MENIMKKYAKGEYGYLKYKKKISESLKKYYKNKKASN